MNKKWSVLVGSTVLLQLFSPRVAFSDDARLRFRADQRGEIVIVANTVHSCIPGTSANGVTCEDARAGATSKNDNRTMIYIDVDGDASTFNSSTSDLLLPSGSAITWAGLYWMCSTGPGMAPPSFASRDRVLLKAPAGAYTEITASLFEERMTDPGYGKSFQGFADVTTAVQAAGAGTYAVANMQCSHDGANLYSGWALVVAYESATLPLRDLTVFDAFAEYRTTPLTIQLAGFLTPAVGDVTSRIGIVTGDGDRGEGDTLALTSGGMTTPMGGGADSLNPTTDVANGTVSVDGVTVTTRNPAYPHTLAFDADVFTTTNALANMADAATITMKTANETIAVGVITFTTDIFAPELEATKSAVDVNGAPLRPGDILEYTLTGKNIGQDPATHLVITDTLPEFTSLVEGSVSIDGIPAGALASYDAGTRTLTVSAGASPTVDGGTLAIGATTQVKLQVKLAGAIPGGTVLSNQAMFTFNGATLGTSREYTRLSDGDTVAPGPDPTDTPVTAGPDVAFQKTVVTDGAADPGDELTYTLTASNNGDDAARDVTLSDALDENLELISVAPSAGTVSSGSATPVVVTVAQLVPGATLTVIIHARVARPFPASAGGKVTNQAVISGSNLPPVLSDDPTVGGPADPTIVSVSPGCECFVAGACVAAGTVDPANGCRVCIGGTSYGPRDAGLACDDGNACTSDDVCNGAGACAGTAVSCTDGVACTSDACNPQTGSCVSTVNAGSCLIDGACIAAGTVRPDVVCQLCDPARSTTAWVGAEEGAICSTGTSCALGTCTADGTCQPTSAGCDDGLACTADSCGATACENTPVAGFCAIAGACFADGAANPTDPCLGCVVGTSQTAWTVLCGTPDAGVPDAPVGSPDAPVGEVDAAAPVADAGTAVFDAAVAAGDARRAADGRITDPLTPTPGSLAGGGCSCRTGGDGASGLPASLLLAFGILVTRRRRKLAA